MPSVYIPADWDISKPLPLIKYERYCQAVAMGANRAQAYIECVARGAGKIASAKACYPRLEAKPYIAGRIEWLKRKSVEDLEMLKFEGKPVLGREDILLAYCVKFKALAVQSPKTTREEADLARAMTMFGSEICKLTNAYEKKQSGHEVRLKLRTTPVSEEEAASNVRSADEGEAL